MTQLRPFTPAEERALVSLAGLPGASTLIVTRSRPSVYEGLSDKGLTSVTLVSRQKRARLTATGRYFARLVAAREKQS